MTRLNDYLRAERPAETEPASFYVPGARDWREVKIFRKSRGQPNGGANEDRVEPPLDTTDTQDIDELAAAQTAAALKALED